MNIHVKVPKGKPALVVTDNREPERGVDVEVIWIEEKRVVPRVDSVEGEESKSKNEHTEQINAMKCKCTCTCMLQIIIYPMIII